MRIHWIDLFLLIMILLNCLICYKRGMLLSIYKAVSFILTIWLAWMLHPVVKGFIIKYTRLLDIIKDKIAPMLQRILVEQAVTPEEVMATEQTQTSFVEGLNIPSLFKNSIMEEIKTRVTESFTEFCDFVAKNIAEICVSIIAILFVIILVTIILGTLKGVLKFISDIPVIGFVNKVLGIVFGFIIGIMQIWLVYCILILFSTSKLLEPVFHSIQSSTVAKYLYENNVIYFAILRVFGK